MGSRRQSVLLLLIAAQLLRESRGDLTAHIEMRGTRGSVSINAGILRTNLTGTCGPVIISIHDFPVVYGASRDPCDEALTGRPLYNVTIKAVGQTLLESNIRHEGRSLSLRTCGRRTCVNLQEASQKMWQARFQSFIIGQAYFVQSLLQDLLLAVLDLAILEGLPTSRAALLFSSSCRLDDADQFGGIELGSSHKLVKSRVELSNVTMMDYLLVKYNERWVCAEVKTITPKEAAAPISMRGIIGSFTFTQDSPFHPTHVAINLWRLGGRAGHYGIHSLPLLPRQASGQDVCTAANTGKQWDPLDVSSRSTSAQGGHISWPVGDLSGRHGTLQGLENFTATLIDWNLPMFGNNSVVGRSVVIHESGGAAWACSTIRPEGEAIRAAAVFRKGVVGRIMFQQAQNDPYTDLTVYVELTHGSGGVSGGHDWHIHSVPLQESESCSKAGGHYNPFSVPVMTRDECRSAGPLWCEAGDYASKHHPISFTPSPARYLITDTSTSLTGPHSIIGRSLVVHGADGASARVACANILLQRATEGRTTAWFGVGDARGELRASQPTDLDPTLVQFTIHGLGGRSGGFHIHLLPVSGVGDDACSSAQIRGHFNPFSIEASTSPAAGNGTDDDYEVGDISGRRGSLLHQDNVTKQFLDMNFPLSGTHGVLGRSLVIHYANGSRMQCASFLHELPSDGEWVRAAAAFSGNISGRISLSQIVYPDGGSGDTTILVDLHSSSSASGKTIEWLIRTQERGGETYNPYDISDQTGSWRTARSPQLCRVGDLMGKHGPVAPGDKVLVTDPNLPLAGDVTVIGRTLTVKLDSLELSSPILPDVPITTVYLQRFTSFNRSAFREALSLILNITPWKVTLLPVSEDSVTMCQRVAFFIIGFNDTGSLSSVQESLGPPCRSPSGSLASSAGRDLRTMAATLTVASLLLLLW